MISIFLKLPNFLQKIIILMICKFDVDYIGQKKLEKSIKKLIK